MDISSYGDVGDVVGFSRLDLEVPLIIIRNGLADKLLLFFKFRSSGCLDVLNSSLCKYKVNSTAKIVTQ